MCIMGLHRVASFAQSPRVLLKSKLAPSSRRHMSSVVSDEVQVTAPSDYGFVGGLLAKKTLKNVTSLLMAAYSEAKSPQARKRRYRRIPVAPKQKRTHLS